MRIKSLTLLMAFSFCLLTCDHGIAPPDTDNPRTGISGTIFYSNWASADSVYLLKTVFFKTFPPQSITNEILSGEAATFPVELAQGLPVNVPSTAYEIELEAGPIAYISVAQQYGPSILTDWKSVGQYDITPNDSLPTPLMVFQDSMLQNIDIYVDFNIQPIQPF